MKSVLSEPSTFENAEAAAAMDRACHAILSHGRTTIDDIDTALKHNPEMAIATALKGLLMMTLARRELYPVAVKMRDRTREILKNRIGTEREWAYLTALDQWLNGRPAEAARGLDDLLQRTPNDSLTLKLVHSISFMLGDSKGMRRSIEGVIDAIDADHPDRGYILGCYAFTLEETGDYQGAEKFGREGVALAPDDAWGVHAVAHVCDMTRRPDEGIKWVKAHHDDWENCNNFRYHLFWHMALFHLERHDISKVLELYDRHVHCDQSDDFRDISNSASLLARLEIEGVRCGKRWNDLADLAARRLDDDAYEFADLHYLMAMSGARRLCEVEKIGARMAKRDQPTASNAARAAARAASGIAAMTIGENATAFSDLARALPALISVGGSHAQRDVFERLTIEAGMRAGQYAETREVIQNRCNHRGALDRFAEDRLAKIDDCLALEIDARRSEVDKASIAVTVFE